MKTLELNKQENGNKTETNNLRKELRKLGLSGLFVIIISVFFHFPTIVDRYSRNVMYFYTNDEKLLNKN